MVLLVSPCLLRHSIRLFAFSWVTAGLLLAAQEPVAETLYIHGEILTGAHLKVGDPSPTPARVHAMAVSAGHVVALGNDTEMLARKDRGSKIVDLQGAFVMPGFNDAHTHMAQAGQQHLAVDLIGSASLQDMQTRIRTYLATAKPGQWILGGGWDQTLWTSKELPTRTDLDAVTCGHPALLIVARTVP